MIKKFYCSDLSKFIELDSRVLEQILIEHARAELKKFGINSYLFKIEIETVDEITYDIVCRPNHNLTKIIRISNVHVADVADEPTYDVIEWGSNFGELVM